jgi:hypothetical protein
MNPSFKIYLFVFSAIVFSYVLHSCSLDQVEKRYPDFHAANSDNLFKKGWIPEELAFSSMRDIYQRTNLDLNSLFFTFTLSEQDLARLVQRISRIEDDFKKPARIRIRRAHADKIKSLSKFIYVNSTGQDTIFLAVDYKTTRVYGWGN